MIRHTPKVLVSGCFDLLHAGHIAFLKTAANYGALDVCVGSDANIQAIKGHSPLFSEQERVYLLNSLECVHKARISTGTGTLDFAPDLDQIKPDIFVVNQDGHSDAKQRLCLQRGIKYVILERVPAHNFLPRSSRNTKTRLSLPYRVCIAGGWLDQPWISSVFPGPVITAQLEPFPRFNDRSGMATSTRKAAEKIWGRRLPSGDPETIAKTIFAYENPPGTDYVSGSQDALGLVFPGINRFNYTGGYWPESIEQIDNLETIQWLQSVVHLIELEPRPEGYDPLGKKHVTFTGVKRLARSAELAWRAIKGRDQAMLGAAINETADSWKEILPLTISAELQTLRNGYSQYLGTSFTGCGGGYLMVISDEAIQGSISLNIGTQAF